jgi:Txe/YoeB family toxin of toxin-antitoxin system
VSWTLVFTKDALRDAEKLSRSRLRPQAECLLAILKEDPFKNPPRYEKLVGDLSGAYSRRINLKHRLVYQVIAEAKIVKVLRMWTHYE